MNIFKVTIFYVQMNYGLPESMYYVMLLNVNLIVKLLFFSNP